MNITLRNRFVAIFPGSLVLCATLMVAAAVPPGAAGTAAARPITARDPPRAPAVACARHAG